MKKAFLICGLTLAILFVGCGKKAEVPDDSVDVSANDGFQVENNKDVSEKNLEDEVASAYQKILDAAPAIKGEHIELEDAAFGIEENRAMFGDHIDCYAIYDINKDGVPELITSTIINFRWSQKTIYTYANGQVVMLVEPKTGFDDCTFDECATANGAYNLLICEKNHVHSIWRGNPVGEPMVENYAYVLEDETLTEVDCNIEDGEGVVSFSDIAKPNL